MQLHNLQKSKTKHKKRVGRGGKRGTTSGRGQKGQKSRSGHRIRPAERDLIIRIPKRRGFRNKPKSEKSVVFNLGDLSLFVKSHSDGSVASLDKHALIGAGLLPKRFRGDVKILGNGEINAPLRVEGLKVSKSARGKIEKAGGSVT
ncbi:MAG: 50S ribosomal protein L15 [bacterium]|nr:50S ribosomal protein L15 [bacterium]